MSKQEFVDRLRAALNGRIAPSLVVDNVNYYEDYINMEIRKGRTEAEVLRALGDPRLIAKTIIETSAKSAQSGYQDADYQNYNSQGTGYQSTGQQGNGYQSESKPIKSHRIPGWLWSVIVIVIIAVIVSLIFSVLSFLAPIIIPIIVILFFVKLFRDWLK